MLNFALVGQYPIHICGTFYKYLFLSGASKEQKIKTFETNKLLLSFGYKHKYCVNYEILPNAVMSNSN